VPSARAAATRTSRSASSSAAFQRPCRGGRADLLQRLHRREPQRRLGARQEARDLGRRRLHAQPSHEPRRARHQRRVLIGQEAHQVLAVGVAQALGRALHAGAHAWGAAVLGRAQQGAQRFGREEGEEGGEVVVAHRVAGFLHRAHELGDGGGLRELHEQGAHPAQHPRRQPRRRGHGDHLPHHVRREVHPRRAQQRGDGVAQHLHHLLLPRVRAVLQPVEERREHPGPQVAPHLGAHLGGQAVQLRLVEEVERLAEVVGGEVARGRLLHLGARRGNGLRLAGGRLGKVHARPGAPPRSGSGSRASPSARRW
jgi:hypothetical protein